VVQIVLATCLIGIGTASWAQNVSCTCRYQGEDYGVGESICVKSPQGMRMATCAMVLNNTSWKFSNAPCPLSLNESVQPDAGQVQSPVRQSRLPAKTLSPAQAS